MSNLRLVIIFLGTTLILCLCLAAWLLSNDKSIPDVFVVTIGGALGALGSILAPTPGAHVE